MKELFTALAKAQAEMEAAAKDSTNPFFKSKYADLNAVMGAVKPALAKHGLGFIQVCHDAENAAKVETVVIHESGEQFACGAVSVPVAKHDAQAYGSALTYARRYSLAAAFGVGAEDDDGERATKTVNAPKATITPTTGAWEGMSEKQKSRLVDLAVLVREAFAVEDVAEAVRIIDDAGLEAEEKVALWTRFDSKQRSAMKKMAAEKLAMAA